MNPTSDTSYPPLSPYLAVQGAADAIEFYQRAFGATERYRLIDSASGQVGHAELTINGTLLMLSEENPAWNQSAQTLGGCPIKLSLMVEDVDATLERAVAAGAEVLMPASDQFYGFRSGTVRDPFGYIWMIERQIEQVSPEEIQRRWDEMVSCEPA